MRYILILLLIGVKVCNAQTSQIDKIKVGGKNNIHYKSDLMSEVLIQNYYSITDSTKVIYDRALGIDIDVYVDTVFKKYTIMFTDKDENKKIMIYDYVRDYFLDEKNDNSDISKLYLMRYNERNYFLIDYMDIFWSHELEISHNEKLPNNCTLLYRVKNVRKMQF